MRPEMAAGHECARSEPIKFRSETRSLISTVTESKVIGNMRIYLVKAKDAANTSENIELLKQYLNEVKDTAIYHEKSAESFLQPFQ